MTATLAESALAQVAQTVAARAADLDEQRTDVRTDLAELGRAGLLDLELSDMVRVVDEVSAHSLAVGFSTWAHHMAIRYLHAAPRGEFGEQISALAAAQRIGVTAMAAGLKQVAGLGQVPISGAADGSDLVISGPIRWASNVFPGALLVLPVRIGERTLVVTVDAIADGVTVDPAPPLTALGATASTSLRLDRIRVAPHQVLTTDLGAFVGEIRPAFLLLQTAFCVGVTRAALTAATEAHTGPLARFGAELDDAVTRATDVRSRLYRWAADPDAATVAQLIRLRLDAAGLAVDVTRLELSLTGGAGYTLGSAANRRFREAAFLPVQSPSEGQLRWELTRYE
ncbi:acyl-CoA dehydrogenase family protein [Mycobacterium sp. DL440]|uniref:acyl-CoA dehydrogenase family protein n=1 Tax=Mycobacterium sp. DL440 TaxID=2675523 RepID=UPI0014223ABB|nr:acyl-CoA dehydrogenase family protein [Mycobacterium sp. DL440]